MPRDGDHEHRKHARYEDVINIEISRVPPTSTNSRRHDTHVAIAIAVVVSVSVSNWAPVKNARLLEQLGDGERVTHWSKLELFNMREHLHRPGQIGEEDLSGLSFYAFWRQYSVEGGRLVRKRTEQLVAVNGVGWPHEAARTHRTHAEFARKTLYAYAPCWGLEGTEYLDRLVNL